jgi:hypothetical protein
MPYYQAGDYYRGDYYRGDFLGLGKLAKKVVGTVARVVGSVVPGPVGMIARAISPPASAGGRVTFFPPEPSIPNPFVSQLPPGAQNIIIPNPGGGGGNYPMVTGGGGTALMACPTKGMRTNKSTYVTRGGGTSRWPHELLVHPKGTECVKTRRLNVANPRALRRALRRASGFVKLARRAHVRLSQFTGRGKSKKKK